MSEVKEFGIRTPLIHFVDIKNCDIIMQKIDGVLVGDLSKTKLVNICKKIGKLVGIMHKNGIAKTIAQGLSDEEKTSIINSLKSDNIQEYDGEVSLPV